MKGLLFIGLILIVTVVLVSGFNGPTPTPHKTSLTTQSTRTPIPTPPPTPIIQQLPDLRIISIQPEPKPSNINGHATLTKGMPYSFKIGVKNIGQKSVNNVEVVMNYQGPISGSTDITYTGPMEIEETKYPTILFTPPEVGTYNVQFKVDPNNKIQEMDESEKTNIWRTTIDVISTTTQADLEIIDVRVEKYVQPGISDMYNLIATVKNNGDVGASSFNAGCEWDCPAGQITHAGADIVQAGYILGKAQFTYQSPFMIQCSGPPRKLYFICTIDNDDTVQETNENNNQWSGQVNIPPTTEVTTLATPEVIITEVTPPDNKTLLENKTYQKSIPAFETADAMFFIAIIFFLMRKK